MAIKVWEGASLYDGKPIIVLVTGHKRASKNTKTKAMVQTFVMLQDTPPQVAVKHGDDRSVCGTCPMASGKGCYVITFQGPLSAWKSGHARPVEAVPTFTRPVRLGAYGDPAAVPGEVWGRVLEGVSKHTGYTHGWRGRPDLAPVVMASIDKDGVEGMKEAHKAGFRTFRVIKSVDELTPGEVLCPASKEAGYRTTCDRCGLCNGKKGPQDKRKSPAIVAHGFAVNKALANLDGPPVDV